jgi:hypothetical protein
MVQGLPPSGRARFGRNGQRYGADVPMLDWSKRLVCSQCGSLNVDRVMSGPRHDPLSRL